MKLTNRQRVLLGHLRNGWSLSLTGTGFQLRHRRLRTVPCGFEWVERRTIDALVSKGVVDPQSYQLREV